MRIIEKGGDFGGTWYWNRYPGAQCDTASFVYMPLLEETGHMPTEKYAHAPEILEHCRRIGTQFDLYDNALFHTEVTDLEWDDERSVWIVRTNRGDEFTTQFIAMGTGPLHVPKLPGIPGVESFTGHSFHTSRWDYEYTGGDPSGAPMDKLADKRVAIIGTGATSVQCVPHLAPACEALYVFQRTPSSVDVRDNRPTDPEWFAEIATPGWQQRWLENFTANQTGGMAEEDLVMDGWTDLARRVREPDHVVAAGGLHAREDDGGVRGLRLREDGGDPRAGRRDRRGRGHGAEPQGVVSPTLQAALLPRRVPAGVQRAGHATSSTPTARVSSASPRTPSSSPASSTRSTASSTRRASRWAHRTRDAPGYDMTGRDGVKLSEYWADGMRTKHGIHVHGFPNAFLVQLDAGRQPDLERAAQPHGVRPHDRDDHQARDRQRLRR